MFDFGQKKNIDPWDFITHISHEESELNSKSTYSIAICHYVYILVRYSLRKTRLFMLLKENPIIIYAIKREENPLLQRAINNSL